MCEKLWSDKLCLLRFRTVIDIVPTRGGIFYISSIRMNCPLPCCGMSCSFLSVCPQFPSEWNREYLSISCSEPCSALLLLSEDKRDITDLCGDECRSTAFWDVKPCQFDGCQLAGEPVVPIVKVA